MASRVIVRQCQQRLLVLWSAAGAISLLVAFVQTSPGGAYNANATGVWQWLLPAITPTLTLMFGAVVAEARAPEPKATVDEFTYRLTFWASLAYLVLIVALLLIYAQSKQPIEDLTASGRLVSSVYALVGILLGAFFVSKKSE